MENYGKYSWIIQMKEHPRYWMFLMRSIISMKIEIHFSYSTLFLQFLPPGSTKVEIYFSYSTAGCGSADQKSTKVEIYFSYSTEQLNQMTHHIYKSRNLFQLFNLTSNPFLATIYKSRNLFQLFNSYFVSLHNFKSNNQFIFSIFYTNFQFIVK